MKRIKFRLATLKDEQYLRELRNSNRKFFISTNNISVLKHHKWLVDTLKSNELTFIAHIDTQCKSCHIGTVSLLKLDVDNNACELGRFIVGNEFRQKGYGHAIVVKFKKICKFLNIKKITLLLKKNNPEAFNFYKKEGFKTVKTKTNTITMETSI